MTFDSAALAHRVSFVNALGIGPLWLRRGLTLPSTLLPTLPMSASSVDLGEDAWQASAVVPSVLTIFFTLCAKTRPDGAAARYLFIHRADSIEGSDALFANILQAFDLQIETQTQTDASNLMQQIDAQSPSLLVVMDATVAQQLFGGSDFAALRGTAHDCAGRSAIVTYGPAHLLRHAADKRKVWDDLLMAFDLCR